MEEGVQQLRVKSPPHSSWPDSPLPIASHDAQHFTNQIPLPRHHHNEIPTIAARRPQEAMVVQPPQTRSRVAAWTWRGGSSKSWSRRPRICIWLSPQYVFLWQETWVFLFKQAGGAGRYRRWDLCFENCSSVLCFIDGGCCWFHILFSCSCLSCNLVSESHGIAVHTFVDHSAEMLNSLPNHWFSASQKLTIWG